MSTAVATDKDRFLEALDRGPVAAIAPQVREAALERYRALPFPNVRTEDWRFTSLVPLLRVPFEAPPAPAEVMPPALPPTDTHRLVFVNGAYAPHLSTLADLPEGVIVSQLVGANPHLVQIQLGRVASNDQVFTALNTALAQGGAHVYVRKGVIHERPIELVYVTGAAGRRVASHPRTLIFAEEASRVTVVERFLSAEGDDGSFTNAVTEIVLRAGAVVDHVKLQNQNLESLHVANTQAILLERSNFSTHYLGLGGGLVRNEVRVRFDGEHAEATVNGLYRAAGRQHTDNFTEIDHARAHCASHELYKGVLNGQAHGVFNGKIMVRPDAQKTDAKQTNKVLLLSEDATINTKPQLEIYADDVKCTHGATVGQLDADMLFYLRARGLDLEAARTLLTFAFANDIVSRVKVEALREELEGLILQSPFAG